MFLQVLLLIAIFSFSCFTSQSRHLDVTSPCFTLAWNMASLTIPSWLNVSSAKLSVLLQRIHLSSTRWGWLLFKMESESRTHAHTLNTNEAIQFDSTNVNSNIISLWTQSDWSVSFLTHSNRVSVCRNL